MCSSVRDATAKSADGNYETEWTRLHIPDSKTPAVLSSSKKHRNSATPDESFLGVVDDRVLCFLCV